MAPGQHGGRTPRRGSAVAGEHEEPDPAPSAEPARAMSRGGSARAGRAATLVQAFYRGMKARRWMQEEFAELQALKREEAVAATQIQAAYRGASARARTPNDARSRAVPRLRGELVGAEADRRKTD